MTPKEYTLHLSSRDSISICPGNAPGDFIVDLGKTLVLEGSWRVELLSFRCDLSSEQAYGIRNLYIFSDICECSFVRDQYLPILANIYCDGEFDGIKRIHETIRNPYSLGVVPHAIQRVRIYIKDSNLRSPSFTNQRSEVTLRLVKHK